MRKGRHLRDEVFQKTIKRVQQFLPFVILALSWPLLAGLKGKTYYTTQENAPRIDLIEIDDARVLEETKQASAPQILASRAFEPSRSAIIARIYEESLNYDIDYRMVSKIVECESGFRMSARGQAGEIGLFQFKISTFNSFKNQMGRQELSVYDPVHQIIVGVWALANGKEGHWVCYRRIYG